MAEWSLLPLRVFLGGTFLYASLTKLANPDFIHASSSISIQASLIAARRSSPIGWLMGPIQHVAVAVGIAIAIAEVAVGVGTLLGLWGRVAALGGALLSFILFLTQSFHSAPWFTGADLVFFFAWTPLIIAGSGTRLSMDATLARRAAHGAKVPDPELVVLPFVQVQQLCGHFEHGQCKVQHGAPCQPHGCPVLEGPRPSLLTRGITDHVDRRTVMLGASRAAVVAAVTTVAAALAGGVGWALHGKGPAKSQPPVNKHRTDVGLASQIPVRQSAQITLPNGDPGIVICLAPGQFVGYDTVCPHAGCTVGYSANASMLLCPCHGSQFDVTTGNRISGLTPTGLTAYTVAEASNGHLYLS